MRAVHRLYQRLVLFVDELALELHRRRQLFVFGTELGFDQTELLDLLDTRKPGVHSVDLGLDQLRDLRRAAQARKVRERNAVSCAYFLTLSWSIITRHVRYGRRSPITTASVTYGENLIWFSSSDGVTFLPPAVTMMSFNRSVMRR